MSVFLNPAAYGASLSGGNFGVMTPLQALKTATKNTNTAQEAVEKAYKDAVAASQDTAKQEAQKRQAQQNAQAALKFVMAATDAKIAKAQATMQAKLQEAARMAGAAAAAGARDDTAETLKKYAPWALGGLALVIVGVVAMRRK
jgi:hypothetical protein